MEEEKLRALYLHIPFCVRKCSYCDFYSLPATSQTMQDYCTRLSEVIHQWGRALPAETLETVYLGGGTPSLLSEKMLHQLLEAVQTSFSLREDVEISLEANPATMSRAKARAFFQEGINRISLGVQSFIPSELQTMGRLHGVAEVFDTVDCIRQAGFDNYNLDVIYGVPGQTLSSWETTLQQVVRCAPEHISMYLLQMDAAVPLAQRIARQELTELEDDVVAEMFYLGDAFLQEQGYQHYEISNFARPGFECRHNLEYWKSHPYLGLGAGAVSFLRQRRFLLAANIKQFLAGKGLPGQDWGEILEELSTPQQRLADALIMGLRCMQGVSLVQMQQRFALPVQAIYREPIEECLQAGLLEYNGDFLRLTKKGWFLSNQVFLRLL